MFSKILIKLIDQAIIPAMLVLSARIISVILISKYLNTEFSLDASGFAFKNINDYVVVNSYSLLAIIGVLSVGLFYNLLKSYIFHEDVINPGLTAKLFSLKVSSLIQNSIEIYTKGAIWISYAYLITIVTGLMSMYGHLYLWVFHTSIVLTLIATVLLVLDIEHKMDVKKIKEPQYEKGF